jgi:hypothetical protein
MALHKMIINEIFTQKYKFNQNNDIFVHRRPSLYVALMSNFRRIKCDSNNRQWGVLAYYLLLELESST